MHAQGAEIHFCVLAATRRSQAGAMRLVTSIPAADSLPHVPFNGCLLPLLDLVQDAAEGLDLHLGPNLAKPVSAGSLCRAHQTHLCKLLYNFNHPVQLCHGKASTVCTRKQ